jgi:hypothetical protein
MTDANQKQLGNTLWSIADQLRGAMDADDFRDSATSRTTTKRRRRMSWAATILFPSLEDIT